MNCVHKIIISTLFVLLPTFCFAGGDAVSGRVDSITQHGDSCRFHFIQSDNQHHLINDCKDMVITVKYARVPWFSWLPFIKTAHPSKKESIEVIEYLKKANQNKETIFFGYMGYGLVPNGLKCSFNSKGLKIMDLQSGNQAVISFHDPI